MKEILLLDLIVRNFMGVKLAEIHPEGKDILIIGENETGKTRFATGWNWLLFDKDIYGKSDFDIKWLDENNNVKDPGLEYTVEGTLSVDGKKTTLKKVFYEKWQKKKGSNEKRFTGHTTDYYINEVPMKKKEYDKKINEIIDEETFKMLTDPDYFCGKMHWEDRREILMDAYGGVTDKEIIKQNDHLSELLEVIEKREISDHKEICKSKKTEINKKIKKIPTRIDEKMHGLPDISDYNQEEIKSEVEKLKKQKKAKEQELSRVENGGEVAELNKQITEIDAELQKIENEHRARYDDKIQSKKSKLNEVEGSISDIKRGIKNRQIDIDDLESIIEKKQKKMQQLRDKWHRENEKEFDPSDFETVTCPDCGNEFPIEDIEKHRREFNKEKAETLEEINRQGKEEKGKVEKLKKDMANKKKELADLETELNELKDKKDKLEDEIEKLQEKAEAYDDTDEYQGKLKEKKHLEEEINQLKEDNKFPVQRINKEITALEDEIESEKDKLKKIDDYNKAQKRIKELKEKERKLAKEHEKLERQVSLCEDFTRAKVSALEGKVNSKFKFTDWKLFEELVNGGIDETCEALHKGVAYNSTLNTGAKILVGIDFINTLSKHYGIRVPVFVDNYESLTKELESESQLIKLKAVEGVKKLKVVSENEEMKEAS